MDKKQENLISRLRLKRTLRSITRNIEQGPEDYPDILIVAMSSAYSDLSTGLQSEVKNYYGKQNEHLTKLNEEQDIAAITPIFRYKLPNFEDDLPECVKDYRITRHEVYEELLAQAKQSGNYGVLINLIVDLKESYLAKSLLGIIKQDLMPRPYLISGDARKITSFIDNYNNNLHETKESTERYAVNEQKVQNILRMKSKLRSERTGIIGAFAIDAKLRLGNRVSHRKALKKYVYQPLEIIAKLPDIEYQIIKREEEIYLTS